MSIKTPREAAFEALIQSYQRGIYLSDSLSDWQRTFHPSTKDFRLAQEISYGTMRMKKALDFFISLLEKKVRLKRKERVLLQMALYQYVYMDKIPMYAIVNESVAIAKKSCHLTFVKFLNAVLRKLETIHLFLPQGDNIEEISIRFSYPEEYVSMLFDEYGVETAKTILDVGNQPPKLMARVRFGKHEKYIIQEPLPVIRLTRFSHKILDEDGQDVATDSPRVCEKSGLDSLPQTSTSEFYIQNVTPAFLIGDLARQLPKKPETILDMCASPGGKAIAIHDLFPKATLHVNDLSSQKLVRLRENLERYGVEAEYFVGAGQEMKSKHLYDLIIIDAPCSNTGVLNKRPEARWRISLEDIRALNTTQKALIEHAKTLLSPNGQIWYLTCSILKEENECLVKPMQVIYQRLILPNKEGWDGGFGAIIQGRVE